MDGTIDEEELSSSNLVTEGRGDTTIRTEGGGEYTSRGSPIHNRRNIKVNI